MKFKKKFSIILLTIICNNVLAGGLDIIQPAPIPPYQSIYLEIDGGYNTTNWVNVSSQFANLSPQGIILRFKNGKNGFAWGGDIGYQFNHYLGIEAGGYDMQTTHTDPFLRADNRLFHIATATITNWFSYGAAKLIFPLGQTGLEVFGKAGVAYRGGKLSEIVLIAPFRFYTSIAGFRPIAGGGLQFHITPNFLISGQYLYIPEGASPVSLIGAVPQISNLTVPATHLITGGLTFMFFV